jgi:outer membrane immunogenic protein
MLGIDTERIVIKDDDVLRLKTGMFGTARARLGYAFGRFLPYVTAGFAFVDIENAGGNPLNAARFLTLSEMRPGLAVGAGAEYAFSQNLVARLEYLYVDTMEYEVRNLENEMMKFDNDIHLVRAGLSYKF